MTEVPPLPDRGSVLFDVRQDGHSLRYRWHPELGIAVLSVWRDARCVGTFQLARDDMPALICALVDSLDGATVTTPTATV